MDYSDVPFIIPPFYLIQLLFVIQTVILLKLLRKKTPELAITPRYFLSFESMVGLVVPILTIYSIIVIGGIHAIGNANWQLFVVPLIMP